MSAAPVVWFTGLSGAGKTTLATRVAEELARDRRPVELVDGDALRHLFPDVGFSRDAREDHVRRVGHLASRLSHHGITVLVALISPYESSRAFARRLCARFVEVHVSTPLAECERRDAKGLYSRARRGEIRAFTGIDDPYEPPRSPELAIDTSRTPVDEAVALVLATLREAP
jgi:adenylylsulfate kinase